MQIFENKKKGHSRVIKLLGNVIYITTSGYKRRTQRFLGNLISTQKTSDENDNETKVTKFLDYVVSKRETDEYFRDNKGAKIYFDVNKQPELVINEGHTKYLVLSVGFDKDCNPLATIASEPENKCFRLPEQLSEWAMTVIGMAKLGQNLFPSEVVFSRIKGRYYVDIL